MFFSQSYPRILHHEFTKRVEKNPRYSLRAFAKFLEISPARLSNVLSGKKGLSEGAARGIATILGFDQEQSDFFCALVNSTHARSKAVREEYQKVVAVFVKKYHTLFMQVNVFEAISDVRHLVLLQILKIEKVAAPLQISLLKQGKDEATIELQSQMIERMVQLGMIEVRDGFFHVIHESFAGPDQVSSEVIRKFHHQVLDQAKSAIDRESIDNRDSFFLMMPFQEKNVPEVRQKIRTFVDSLIDQYGDRSKADSVYGLSSQFFPFERVK